MPDRFIIPSPFGPLVAAVSTKGLCSLSFGSEDGLQANTGHTLSKQLSEYFKGQRKLFDLPLDYTGTEFQMDVWNTLCEVPYGTALSYSDIALKIGRPNAYRAVGNAVGANPICIIIPCHRVIAAQGRLGGYSGGIWYKKQLLKLEGIAYKE